MFRPVQKSPSNGGRVPTFLISSTLQCLIHQFNAYIQMFPLKAVHLIVLILPKRVIVTIFHVIGCGAPRGWPGLYRLTLRKEVEELTEGGHLNRASSYVICQKGGMLSSQCLTA